MSEPDKVMLKSPHYLPPEGMLSKSLKGIDSFDLQILLSEMHEFKSIHGQSPSYIEIPNITLYGCKVRFIEDDRLEPTGYKETTMSKDSELFELCKQVFEATGWDDLEKILIPRRAAVEVRRSTDNEGYIAYPLYTSDYLLEKLETSIKMPDPKDEPHVLVVHSGVVKRNIRWEARAYVDTWYEQATDTPLKAILKLTLALHKENLL